MIKDPHAAREAQKYDNPIPSREVILEILAESTGPLKLPQIAEHLHIDDEERLEALRRRLIAMERDGQVISNRKGAYGRLDKMNLVRGRVQGHRDGFGFVIPSDGSQGDVYLPNRQMRRVFDGDEVVVRVTGENFRGRREGSIVEVLARNTQQLVGRLMAQQGVFVLRPDNPRIVQEVLIPPDAVAGAQHGQLVVVDITEYPDRHSPPRGKVAEVLGEHLAPGMEIDVAVRSHGVPHIWPQAVLDEAARFSPEVLPADKANRVDLTALPLVTIDGEDARDFDDAVFCEPKKGGGWRLYVAIADVSHYVAVGSELDKEAAVRGNSVYFPQHVVPMLPEALSNGLCSLNPAVDRLCMVAEITISASGRLTGYRFYEAVMHSKARLTYTQVGQILAERDNKRSDVREQYRKIVPHLDHLQELYQTLREARQERGAIDFESQETRIIFDANRKIEKIIPVTRNDAHKLIEECMLAANVCAAKFLEAHGMEGLYRVHGGPKEEKLELLREYLGGIGIALKKGRKITPADYQVILQSIAGRPDAHLIQTVMLRSMNQAVYQPDNIGHFGLAYEAYAHFTSPIRRYPDLLIHRAIRAVVRSEMPSRKVKRIAGATSIKRNRIYPYEYTDLQALGEQCSATERRADDATRDVVSWLKCEYLQNHLGEVFEGVVASVTGFGLFIELRDLYIEGLLHVTGLPQDYYRFDPARHVLAGERAGREYRLGDSITVQVARVNLEERKIDFELVAATPKKRAKVVVSEQAKALAEEFEAKQKSKKGRSRKNKNRNKNKAGNAVPSAVAPVENRSQSAAAPAKPDAKPQAKPQPQQQPQKSQKSRKPKGKAATQSEVPAKPKAGAKPQATATAPAAVKTKAAAKVKATVKTPAAAVKTAANAKPAAKTKAAAKPQAAVKPKSKQPSKPAPKTQAKPTPQAKPAPKPQAKPAPKPQAKPAPKPQAKPAPKPQAKSAPPAQGKSAAKQKDKAAVKQKAGAGAKPPAKSAAKPPVKGGGRRSGK